MNSVHILLMVGVALIIVYRIDYTLSMIAITVIIVIAIIDKVLSILYTIISATPIINKMSPIIFPIVTITATYRLAVVKTVLCKNRHEVLSGLSPIRTTTEIRDESKVRSCVKVEVAVLGSRSLTVLTAFVDVNQH